MDHRIIVAAVLIFAAANSNAVLLGRAPLTPGGTDYQAYYDTDIDITWLADANLPASQSFGLDAGNTDCWYRGSMCSYIANGFQEGNGGWIGRLNESNYLGANTWRLPKTQQPDPTCTLVIPEGSAGYFCTRSELGHLFYEVLGGTAGIPLSQSHNINYALFKNIEPHNYSTECIVTGYCGYGTGWGWNIWAYDLASGFQNTWGSAIYAFVWPVADGDPLKSQAAVPIPAAACLFGGALGVLGWAKRRAR